MALLLPPKICLYLIGLRYLSKKTDWNSLGKQHATKEQQRLNWLPLFQLGSHSRIDHFPWSLTESLAFQYEDVICKTCCSLPKSNHYASWHLMASHHRLPSISLFDAFLSVKFGLTKSGIGFTSASPRTYCSYLDLLDFLETDLSL